MWIHIFWQVLYFYLNYVNVQEEQDGKFNTTSSTKLLLLYKYNTRFTIVREDGGPCWKIMASKMPCVSGNMHMPHSLGIYLSKNRAWASLWRSGSSGLKLVQMLAQTSALVCSLHPISPRS